MKASHKPGHAARSFQGQKDSTGVLFLHISRLTSESARADRDHAVGEAASHVHHTTHGLGHAQTPS